MKNVLKIPSLINPQMVSMKGDSINPISKKDRDMITQGVENVFIPALFPKKSPPHTSRASRASSEKESLQPFSYEDLQKTLDWG